MSYIGMVQLLAYGLLHVYGFLLEGVARYNSEGMSSKTWWELIQGADRALAFTSGMAALAAVVRLVKAGEHILAGDDIYGGTSRLLAQVVPGCGVDVTNVDTTDPECVCPYALAAVNVLLFCKPTGVMVPLIRGWVVCCSWILGRLCIHAKL
jgi:hypothetical protein